MRQFCIALIAGLVTVSASALTEAVDGYTWTYRINDDTVEICRGVSPDPSGLVTVPSTLGGRSVTKIANYAFQDCRNLTTIVMPDSITGIGNYAFSGCSGLTSISISDGVTSIGFAAFRGCSGLMSVTIPQYVCSRRLSSIFESSYHAITNVIVSSGTTNIVEYAFNGCCALVDVAIPSSLTSIGDYAFSGCSKLTSVSIPSGVTSIGMAAFANCNELTNITVSNSNPSYKVTLGVLLTKDGKELVAVPGGKSSVTIPSSVRRIGISSFSECQNLTKITIPQGVESIGKFAFNYCTNLTSVTLPDSVKAIGPYAFKGCAAIRYVKVPQYVLSDYIDSEDPVLGILVHGMRYVFSDAYQYITNVSYSSVLTRIGWGAFSGCANLSDVLIPETVSIIGDAAFADCHSIKEIEIPDGVTMIGSLVFSECHSLTNVVIGRSVTSIGERGFNNCDNLASISILGDVLSIGDGAFDGCNIIDATVPGWPCRIPFNTVTNLVISDGTRNIRNGAFANCIGLKSVTMPNSLTNIGQRAFYCCSNLTSLTIPSKLKNIASYAFNGCHSLSSVTVSSEVNNIGSDAFRDCSGLTNIVFEGNVPTVGQDAFTGVNPSCVVYVRKSSVGWDDDGDGRWNGLELCYIDDSPIPELNPSATDQDVAVALDGVTDASLAENVTNVAQYAAYRSWALSVTNVTTTAQMIKESTRTWLSYAFAADALIDKELTSDDVKIESFAPVSTDGKFEFTVSVKDVNIGGGMVAVETLKENLKKVLGVEGAATLSPDGFSSDNIEITIDAPVDGNARFTVSPPADAGNSFFMRVKVK